MKCDNCGASFWDMSKVDGKVYCFICLGRRRDNLQSLTARINRAVGERIKEVVAEMFPEANNIEVTFRP